MRQLTAFAIALVLLCLAIAPGHADKRVALVIGNGAYKNVPALPNTQNDANDLAESFGRLGFSVKKVTNANFDDMRRALLQFGRDSVGVDMAVVFFAGHGMEIGGENWLVPVDAELRSDRDVENEAIALRSVMLQAANASSLGLVILDACRNNPFAAKMQRSARVRAVDRGLSRVEPTDNVLVAYASKDGTTASDGNGRNSPFTAALLSNLEVPGIEIRFLLASVRDDVMAATKKEQQPFVYGSLSKQAIYLKEPQQPQLAVVALPVVPRIPASPCAGVVLASVSSRPAHPLSASEECAVKPKDVFKECDKCPEMVVVPAGSFMMGSSAGEAGRNDSEGPQHHVTIGNPFSVGKFHITVDEFAAFVTETGYDTGSKCRINHEVGKIVEEIRSWRDPEFAQAGSHPAVCLNWNDAKAYVAWLSNKIHKLYRLLTEAEWEYATRAGTTTRYFFGNDDKDICRYGNGADQTTRVVTGYDKLAVAPCSDGYVHTAPAGSFLPNGFGLYDMQGNAFQWLEDCSHNNYTGAPEDSSAWVSGDCSVRVLRGSAWTTLPKGFRTASRAWTPTIFRENYISFRVARTLTP